MIKISNDLLTSKQHNTLEETINQSISSALQSQEDTIQLEDLGNPSEQSLDPIFITDESADDNEEQYDEDEAILAGMDDDTEDEESYGIETSTTVGLASEDSDDEDILLDDEDYVDETDDELSENNVDNIGISTEADAEVDFDEQLLESLDTDDDDELEISKRENEAKDLRIGENSSDTLSKIVDSLERLDTIEYSEDENDDLYDAEESTENTEEDRLDADPEFAGLSLDLDFDDEEDDEVEQETTSSISSVEQDDETILLDMDDTDDEDDIEQIEAVAAPTVKNKQLSIDEFLLDETDDIEDDEEDLPTNSDTQPDNEQTVGTTAQSVAQLEQENAKLKAQLLEAENAKLQAQLRALQQTTSTSKQQPVGLNTGAVIKKPLPSTEQQKSTTNTTSKDQERLQRWQRYSQMPTSDLWKIVFKFMTAFGVKEHPIKQSLLEQEFGPACVKKLEQSYIIKTKDGYTC